MQYFSLQTLKDLVITRNKGFFTAHVCTNYKFSTEDFIEIQEKTNMVNSFLDGMVLEILIAQKIPVNDLIKYFDKFEPILQKLKDIGAFWLIYKNQENIDTLRLLLTM